MVFKMFQMSGVGDFLLIEWCCWWGSVGCIGCAYVGIRKYDLCEPIIVVYL